LWEDSDGFLGEGEDFVVWEVKRVLFGWLLRSSGPRWDGVAVEFEKEGSQATVDGVKNIVMAGGLSRGFWPYVVLRFRGLTPFNDSAKTTPLLIVVAIEEAVAATCGTKVAGDGIGTVVGCEVEKTALGWR